MNKLLLFFIFLTSSICLSQNTTDIEFTWKNDKAIPDKKVTNLKLPVQFTFSSEFLDKSISFLDDKGTVMALNVQFGPNGLKSSGKEKKFIIIISEDGSVIAPNIAKQKKITENFTMLIDVFKIKITFDSDSEPKDDEEKEKEKENDEYKPGYVYYDAIKLAESNNDAVKFKILQSYGYPTVASIDENLFLKDLINPGFVEGDGDKNGFGSLLTNLGGTDVTNLAAGMARFLAQRTKEELNEAFFNKMKEQLNAYPELKTAFPKTAAFLDVIETYSYASVIQVLKEAFETDVQNLPENLYNIKDLTRTDCNQSIICSSNEECRDFKNCQDRLDKLSAFFETQNGRWVSLGLFTVKEGIQSTNPAEFLKNITLSEELENLKTSSQGDINNFYKDYNIASTIELTNLISQSLISKDSKQVWITNSELASLFTKKDAFKIYLGLLLSYEQRTDNQKKVIVFYKDSSEKSTITFGKVLLDIYGTTDQYQSDIKNLIRNSYTAYSAANNAVKKIIAASEKSVEAEPQALYDYYRSFTSSLKSIVSSSLLKKVNKDFSKDFNKVEQFLNPAVDMAYHTATQKYSAAIYDATILLNNLNADNNDLKKMTKSFVKYGTLISTVAGAQSSDEVKEALEASVLPVGSSSIKRKTNWSFSINAYVGAFWSYKNTAVSQDSIPSLGLAAPIGFTASKGTRKGNWGGFSANIQIIDLGALVNYYLINGDAATLPNDFNVKLSNIFSPGFNLLYNIPKTPLSVGWGGQYIPTLYKYEQINGANNLVATNAWRWQISLLVDIPLFNLKVWDF